MSIRIGDSLPDFELQDENKETFHSSQLKGKAAVLFFYPKADSPGCTKEACSFRDQFEDFKDAGVEVVGLSSDSPEEQKRFKQKHNLPYTLLSDKDKSLRKKMGIKGNMFGLVPGRETFIFNKEGELVHRFNSQLGLDQHVKESLKALGIK